MASSNYLGRGTVIKHMETTNSKFILRKGIRVDVFRVSSAPFKYLVSKLVPDGHGPGLYLFSLDCIEFDENHLAATVLFKER